jgi:hypothetical protein
VNEYEVAKLLTIASMIDNRTVAPETVTEWTRVVGHIPFEQAREAVEQHFRESTSYLMPAHVTAQVRRVREQHALNGGPVECPDHPYYPLPCDKCRRLADDPD